MNEEAGLGAERPIRVTVFRLLADVDDHAPEILPPVVDLTSAGRSAVTVRPASTARSLNACPSGVRSIMFSMSGCCETTANKRAGRRNWPSAWLRPGQRRGSQTIARSRSRTTLHRSVVKLLIEDYEVGASTYELAKHYNVCRNAARDALGRAGCALTTRAKRAALDEEQRPGARRLFAGGATRRELVALYGSVSRRSAGCCGQHSCLASSRRFHRRIQFSLAKHQSATLPRTRTSLCASGRLARRPPSPM